MADVSRPGWQTDDLQDAWVEGDDVDDSSSVSLTEPLETHIVVSASHSHHTTATPVGTFLIRTDVPPAPILAPVGRWSGGAGGGGMKDFFSPLKLERMFDPVPPSGSSLSSSQTRQKFPAGGDTPLRAFPSTSTPEPMNPWTPHAKAKEATPGAATRFPVGWNEHTLHHDFTFQVPRSGGGFSAQSRPQAQSTPGNAPPATTPTPLRLFRLQYDTFTREHLSAVVDAIAVEGTESEGGSSTRIRAMGNEGREDPSEDLRSTKRVKLSPPSDYYEDGEGAGEGASIKRPLRTPREDGFGRSRSRKGLGVRTAGAWGGMMRGAFRGQVTNHLIPQLPNIDPWSKTPSQLQNNNRETYSSAAHRQKALDLMAQIKQDVHTAQRVFSGDTDGTRVEDRFYASSSAAPPLAHQDYPKIPHREKENLNLNFNVQSPIKATKTKPKVSPRKILPRTGSTDDVGRELVDQFAGIAIRETNSFKMPVPQIAFSKYSPDLGILPVATSTTNEQPYLPVLRPIAANRFVSTSTTGTGTTLTAGSAPFFVRHAPSSGSTQMRRITPEDVPALPQRVGKMVFDDALMKWVKGTADASRRSEGDSEDPFKDIESLEDSRGRGRRSERRDGAGQVSDLREIAKAKKRERGAVMGEAEMELTGFSFRVPSPIVVRAMTGVGAPPHDDRHHSGTEDEDEPSTGGHDEDEYSHDGDPLPSHGRITASMPSHRISSTPIRSVLKSASTTPVMSSNSAGRHGGHHSGRRHRQRRSVSFSDGRRDGPILGVGRNASVSEGEIDRDRNEVIERQTPDSGVTSVRSRRIAAMMRGLEGSDSSEEESEEEEMESPSLKTSASSKPRTGDFHPLTERTHDSTRETSSFNRNLSRRTSVNGNGNATFLTECSFGVARDRLVEVITDVQPFEPHWEDLACIDLSEKMLESVARLKELLPRLHELILDSNQIAWLSGIPSTVRTLSVASNNLTGITSFGHLRHLERLDISHNDVDSLRQLECLRSLKELRADGNSIQGLEGLEHMGGLVKLSVQGNRIHSVDLMDFDWGQLEVLNLSQNRLSRIGGMGSLTCLITMNLDNNVLTELDAAGVVLPRLKVLRVSGNRLQGQLNVAAFPNLRTLYADGNSLVALAKVGRLTKLENLSMRNQSGRAFNLSTREIRDVKRVYLSGNPLKIGFLSDQACYNLVYMELAACRLSSLPTHLANLAPNLRALNLNYNFLVDGTVKSLEGLGRLAKLTIVGSRFGETKPLIRIVRGMPEMELVDFRMNPCTLSWYLPLLVRDVPDALRPSGEGGPGRGDVGYGGGGDDGWAELDTKFRRNLPNDAYLGRLAYRGLMMRACPKLKRLDGVEVTEKERIKAAQILTSIWEKNGGKGTAARVR